MMHPKKLAAAAAVTLAVSMSFAALLPAMALPGKQESAASVSAFSKSDVPGALITFTKHDFTSRVSGSENLSAIVLSSLPEGGILRLAGRQLQTGEAVPLDMLDTLCYVPDDAAADTHTGFSFLPVFSETGAGAAPVTVSINLSAKPNTAPIAQDLSFETYAGIKLCGALQATDPDGDAVTFSIVKKPKKGTVEITEEGFSYLPSGSKSGSDSFTYVATDLYGNPSKEATVSIEICKRSGKDVFSYTDLENHPAHYAALKLREAGVFAGESFGSESFLYPEQPVSRAEFVAMTAAVADLAMPTAAIGTGLSDNEAIPTWAQPYVAAALNSGVVCGESAADGNRVFRAEDGITRAEAASIIDRALELTDDGRIPTFRDAATLPQWATQSVVNTTAAGIVSVFADNTVRAGSTVTRGDAVCMLYQMLQFRQDKADDGSSFLGIFG